MAGSRKRNRPEYWNEVDRSPVVHLSDLPEHTLEIDVINALEKFGSIKDLAMMPHRRQALVEFNDLNAAEKLVSRCSEHPLTFSSHRVRVNFSTSKHIIQRQFPSDNEYDNPDGPPESRVLLFTIYNAHYPITVDVIKQITSRHGRVVRIVIFQKTHVQAMVEFKSVEDAKNTKRYLNGADIYSGCCTLKIEFARCSRLSVTKNDQETWDFEQPSRSPGSNRSRDHEDRGGASLMGRFTRSSDRYEHNRSQNGHRDKFQSPADAIDLAQAHILDQLALAVNPALAGFSASDFRGRDRDGSPVIMVYNMNNRYMNCDRLFNILCLYGNVVRIKFLHSKEGAAMAQMNDVASAERTIRNLSGVPMMNNQLLLRPSKQLVIMDVANPYDLHDGSPSFKDYNGCRENRFTNPEKASKNRVYPPSNTLHYWNCPPEFSKEQLSDVLVDAGAKSPTLIAQFPNSHDRPASGLVEWDDISDAMEALAFANHYSIPYPSGKFPFILKLSFSNSPIHDHSKTSGSNRRPQRGGSMKRRSSPSPKHY